MYKIKQIPEDFVVKEISSVNVSGKGDFSYFILKKRNYTTLRAVGHIASKLGIEVKKIGFAGAKDKNAVTEQLISIKSKDIERIKNIELKDIELEFRGFGDKPISLGDLEGNRFGITVRNLEGNEFRRKERFLNLFGEQRFSTNNADVGKAIVKKDFKKAVELILENEKEFREAVEDELQKSPNNFVGALRKLPKKLLMMFIHAYQSSLWNQCALRLENEEENTLVPIIGFGTELDGIKNPKIKEIIREIMEWEDLNERDFIIRQLQSLSPEGDKRWLFAKIGDLKIIKEANDDLNKGKKKIRIKFFLKKGCYATEAVKTLFRG